MGNNDDIVMAMQQALIAQLRISRERLGDRNIEVQTSEEGMRIFNEAIERSFVERMRPLQDMYNSAMVEMNRYVVGIDPYRQVDEKPIQDDDQIIM